MSGHVVRLIVEQSSNQAFSFVIVTNRVAQRFAYHIRFAQSDRFGDDDHGALEFNR